MKPLKFFIDFLINCAWWSISYIFITPQHTIKETIFSIVFMGVASTVFPFGVASPVRSIIKYFSKKSQINKAKIL